MKRIRQLKVKVCSECAIVLLGKASFFLGGGGLGSFGIFSQKSVGPPLRFNEKNS